MITPQILFHTFHELQARGLDPARDPDWSVFRADGTLPNHQRISFLQSQTLLLRALDLSGDPDLGLAVGYRQTFASFGLVAAAMLASPTLRDAVHVGLRYHSILGTMLDFDATERPDGGLLITMQSRFAGSPVRRFLMQEAHVMILIAARFMSAGRNPVLKVTTPFRPVDRRRFSAFCACEVEYGAERQSVLLAGPVLDMANPQADSFAFAETQLALQALVDAEQGQRDMLHAIEARIIRSLPEVEPLARVAAAFGTSERSLRRRLEEAGTSYRALLHTVRLARARARMNAGGMKREQIAHELGFEDARSLRRLLQSRQPS